MANTSPFLNAKLKIERAYHHVQDVERWFADFIDLNTHSMGIYPDPETGKQSIQIIVPSIRLPALSLPPIIGDAVHNLRAALDYVIAEILQPFEVDPEKTAFPIDVTRHSLIGKSHYRVIKRHAPDIARIIADLIDSRGSEFVRLNQLDRIDKHRLLIAAAVGSKATVRAIEDENNLPADLPPGTLLVLPLGRLITPDSPMDLHNKRNSNAPMEIRFGKGEPFEDEPVIPTLHQLLQLVAGVIQTIEAHLQGSPPTG